MSIDPYWAYPDEVCSALGISRTALLLLQRDRQLVPDCATCGRNRWRWTEITARTEELRDYLRTHYPSIDIANVELNEVV